MRLRPVIPDSAEHARTLFDLLAERTPEQSISHKRMPTMAAHRTFIRSRPYKDWFLVDVDGEYVGSIYLSRQDEIGVAIFQAHQRKGYGYEAVRKLMHLYGPRRYLWNANPANAASIALARKLGFAHIQNTYALEE